MLYLDSPPLINLLPAPFALQTIVFNLKMIAFNYDLHFEPLLIVRQILFYPFYNFFLENEVQRKDRKIVSVSDQILQFTSLYINFTAYFYLIIGFLLCLFNYHLLLYIVQQGGYFLHSFPGGTASLLCALSNSLISNYMLIRFSMVNITLPIVIFTFTLVVFTRLKQANSLLFQPFTSKTKLNLEVFLRFASFHTKTLALITSGNGYFGSLLVYFLLIYLPMNAYLSIQIVLGSFPPFPTFTVMYMPLSTPTFLAFTFSALSIRPKFTSALAGCCTTVCVSSFNRYRPS